MKGTTILVIIWIAVIPVFSQNPQEGLDYSRKIETPGSFSAYGFTMVSYEMVKGMILVQAEMEGHLGNFILDTGSPTLIINDKNITGEEEKWVNVTGEYTARPVKINQFKWAGIQKNGIDAIALDISHLEQVYQRELLGVIGYRMFSEHEILIDAINKQITIFKTNTFSRKNKHKAIATIPFKMHGHVPVVELVIGTERCTFGLDSGCSANLIANELINKMPESKYSVLRQSGLQGFSAEPKEVPVIGLEQVYISEWPISELEFLVTDLSKLKDSGMELDGLLGYPFFENLAFSIDYNSGEINIWQWESREITDLVIR